MALSLSTFIRFRLLQLKGSGAFRLTKRSTASWTRHPSERCLPAAKVGAAGYVAIELVTGSLNGKHGSFALQHFATMDGNGPAMQVIAVPGSGTGELKGIEGTFTIRVENGRHFYDFDYALPE